MSNLEKDQEVPDNPSAGNMKLPPRIPESLGNWRVGCYDEHSLADLPAAPVLLAQAVLVVRQISFDSPQSSSDVTKNRPDS